MASPKQERFAHRHPQAGFEEGLVREASLHKEQGGFDGFAERDLAAQAPLLTFRPRGGEDFVLHEVEHSLCFCLADLGAFAGREGLSTGPLRRTKPKLVPIVPATSASSTRATAATGPLFRRANFRSRYAAEGGQASTGSSARYRSTSAAKALADS